MKKIIKMAGIALAVAALLGLTGCPGNVEKHEHTFTTEWSSDETHHWHAATCEHTDAVADQTEHVWNAGVVIRETTCAEAGVKQFICKVCSAEQTEEIPKLPHIWDEGVVTTKPTLAAEGVKLYICVECEDTKTESIEKIPYNWYETPVDFKTGAPATVSSEYVLFGIFPKTIMAADVTFDPDPEAVTMGANTYYKAKDGMYYAKVTANPHDSSYKYSDGTPITKDEEFYFLVEPIKWKVLTKDYNGTGRALLLAEEILTANVHYYEDPKNNRTIDGKIVYPNNYQHSQIRAYLNGLTYQGQNGEESKWNGNGFLQTAFTETAQERIATTNVDNSPASTTDAGNYYTQAAEFACENTEDKIFLLSEKEVTTNAYGFAACDSYGIGNARIRIPTDYAKANRAFYSTDGYGGCWWLRSPMSDYATEVLGCFACAVFPHGIPYVPLYDVVRLYGGVVPALTMSLE